MALAPAGMPAPVLRMHIHVCTVQYLQMHGLAPATDREQMVCTKRDQVTDQTGICHLPDLRQIADQTEYLTS